MSFSLSLSLSLNKYKSFAVSKSTLYRYFLCMNLLICLIINDRKHKKVQRITTDNLQIEALFFSSSWYSLSQSLTLGFFYFSGPCHRRIILTGLTDIYSLQPCYIIMLIYTSKYVCYISIF